MSSFKIPWWYSHIPSEDFNSLAFTLEQRSLSLGKYVEQFQKEFSSIEKSKYAIATTSGTTALILAGLAAGINPGDQVIVPNRTWIATANAFRLLGAEVVVAPVSNDNMLLQAHSLDQFITDKTKAIVPVSLNGRNVITQELLEIANSFNLWIIEDAAQGFMAPRPYKKIVKSGIKYCRTYSFSMAKFITTGQGGMVLTNDESFANELSDRRAHGVKNVTAVDQWIKLGSNFRMSDLQASIGLSQLKRLKDKKSNFLRVYDFYKENLNSSFCRQIPVNTISGEIPIYSEFLSSSREEIIKLLSNADIEVRAFYPDISTATYLNATTSRLKTTIFQQNGFYLPSGDGMSDSELSTVCSIIDKAIS